MIVLALAFTLHFLSDFILQPRPMSNRKSEDWRWLAGHLAIQLVIMAAGMSYVVDAKTSLYFSALNTVVHGVIDWYIWRGYKWLVLKRLQKQAKATIDYRVNQQKLYSGYASALVDEEVKLQASHWKYWEDHWFFVTIGLDQLLHGLTLIALAGILKL